MSSNDCKSFNQSDRKRNISDFDTKSLRCANAFENFENVYQTMANDRMSEYQGYIPEEIPNLLVKCCDPREESSEHKRKNLKDGLVTLSTVGRYIRNACVSLLGMDPCKTNHLLENTDYQLMDLISFDTKQQASFKEVELLDVNVENNNEITSEKLESGKYHFKRDSSPSRALGNK
ncbi:hypothetical protein NPIL_103251 [Nephila pilipes]|uniref:Uncharacterized protein n=1 Tax=Nephila pilipes TaxID=299642 RepID=A0A8X6PWB1_NEPPI|nr:hypothetical protein NPIL_103251 [Nephila pilipes]